YRVGVRFDPYSAAPDAYEASLGLARQLRSSLLDGGLRSLVEIRASQVNGCAFCSALHLNDARKAGVPQVKLDSLAGWTDSIHFSDQERAALDLTDAVCRVGDGRRVGQATWASARAHFDDDELANLLFPIALVNFYNRINVAVEMPDDIAAFDERTPSTGAPKAVGPTPPDRRHGGTVGVA
ncbi:MAG: alkylhydroperoxidase, partial [Acidimicrobiaceae bacterium]|nr:alkylhydroperoxidase [Acidimicrobiaceae bacterium]